MVKGTVEGSLTKPAHLKMHYTLEQAEELNKCRDPVTGPEYFLRNFFFIQHPTLGMLKFDPYDYQVDLIHNYHNYRFGINMLGRQMGKTTVAAGYLVWYAMFVEESQILIAANKGKSSAEIMTRVRYAYENVPDHIRAGVVEYNKGSITFDNRSRIESETTSETTGRGKSLSLIYLDEFAFVPENMAEEFWIALSPTLSTGGKLIITSTPNSDEDTFAQIWRDAERMQDEHGNDYANGCGANGFKAYKAVWHQKPGLPDDFEQVEKVKMGVEKFRREHLCIAQNSKVHIKWPDGTTKYMTIGELENLFSS